MRRPERFIKKGQTIGPCWICNGKLDVLTDGNGQAMARCARCVRRIGLLEEAARRRNGAENPCEICGSDCEGKNWLCPACKRADRSAQERQRRELRRLRSDNFETLYACHDCGKPREYGRRKWCLACAQKIKAAQRARSTRKAILQLRARERATRGEKHCDGCGMPITYPRRWWCADCAVLAHRRQNTAAQVLYRRKLRAARQRRAGVTATP